MHPCAPKRVPVYIGGFQYPKSAHAPWSRWGQPSVTRTVLSDCLRTVLCIGGRGNAAGELPYAGGNHFAVERVDFFHHRFGLQWTGRSRRAGSYKSDIVGMNPPLCSSSQQHSLAPARHLIVVAPGANGQPRRSFCSVGVSAARRVLTCSVPAFHRTISPLLPGRQTVVGRSRAVGKIMGRSTSSLRRGLGSL